METDNDDPLLSLPGYHLKLNSVGQGRGIASYYKPELVSWDSDIKTESAQLAKY